MKLIRFLFFLCIIFFLAFFFSGGTSLFQPGTLANIRETASSFIDSQPAARTAAPAAADSGEITVLDRAGRMLFLRSAVQKAMRSQHPVTVADIPDSLRQAVLAVEDNRFYSHHGFDPEAIARAALVNLQYGQIEEGASTITQQLVKNLFLDRKSVV